MAGHSPVGKRLKEARLEAGLSQKRLGIAAGIDEFVASARMNQYETGKHSPDFSMIRQIAKVLKLPEAFFYADDDVLAQLIKTYAQLGRRKRKFLIDYLSRMKLNQSL